MAPRHTLTFREAVDLLRVINDVADDEGWSMVSVHLQVWSQYMLKEPGAPDSGFKVDKALADIWREDSR